MRIRSGISVAVVASFALPALAVGAIVALPRAIAVAKLRGENEVPSIITNASGDFTAKIFADHVDFKLNFSGLTGDTLFAHIHVGQQHTNGNVMVFLCNNTATGPAPRPCPNGSGTVTGTFSAADVLGLAAGQGVDAQEFAAVLQAIAEGASYANVHTTAFPTGEIRSQLLQIGPTPAGE